MQDDVVGADVVAEPLAEAVDEALELGVRERVLLAAAVADGVMMVLAAGVGGLEAGGAGDVDAVHEPELGERVQRPVDARQADGAARVAQAVVDLLGAQAAGLAPEQLEHLAAGAACAVPGARELLLGVLGPGLHLEAHGNENRFQ